MNQFEKIVPPDFNTDFKHMLELANKIKQQCITFIIVMQESNSGDTLKIVAYNNCY